MIWRVEFGESNRIETYHTRTWEIFSLSAFGRLGVSKGVIWLGRGCRGARKRNTFTIDEIIIDQLRFLGGRMRTTLAQAKSLPAYHSRASLYHETQSIEGVRRWIRCTLYLLSRAVRVLGLNPLSHGRRRGVFIEARSRKQSRPTIVLCT